MACRAVFPRHKKSVMKKRHVLSFLLSCTLMASLIAAPSAAALGSDQAPAPAVTTNINGQDYAARWATTVKSYLFENDNSGLTRVEYIPSGNKVIIEDYSSSYKLLSSRTIPLELSVWGGFFKGKDSYYIVCGQENNEEDNNKEVIRIIRYSKDWTRLGSCGLFGANTIVPFFSGAVRFAEHDGLLYIRTAHKMYANKNDGKNHQANMSLIVREKDMKITDTACEVKFTGAEYVSHSMNQFILIDQNDNIVALDHGDAYPRSLVLSIFPVKAGAESFGTNAPEEIDLLDIPGATGDNTTGASVGGFAETRNAYVTAYAYDGSGTTDLASKRSVYLGVVSKDSHKVSNTKLSEPGVTNPVLAPAGLDGGYVLWTAASDVNYDYKYESTAHTLSVSSNVNYVKYDASGTIGQVKTAAGALSDCAPVLYNGKLVWYVTNNSAPVFYELSDAGLTSHPVFAGFKDTLDNESFAAAAEWGVREGIADAVSQDTFGALLPCTRGEIVNMLWRCAERPAPASPENPFTDVDPSNQYYTAIIWAYHAGVTSGISKTKFAPDATASRSQAVTFIWRATGMPVPDKDTHPFTDVKGTDYYITPVLWAYNNDPRILQGTSATTFSPYMDVSRIQMITLLFRCFGF